MVKNSTEQPKMGASLVISEVAVLTSVSSRWRPAALRVRKGRLWATIINSRAEAEKQVTRISEAWRF